MTYTKEGLAHLLSMDLDETSRAVLEQLQKEALEPEYAIAQFEDHLVENLIHKKGCDDLGRYKLNVLTDRLKEDGKADPEYPSDFRDFRLLLSAIEDFSRTDIVGGV